MAHFSNDEYKNIVRAGVIGHAVGDALGVPAEFSSRNELKDNPVSDMTGYGAHYVPAGSWSDDTSMEIALMQSIIDCKSIDYRDIMEKFSSWCQHDEFTATGHIFDIGGACSKALYNFYHYNISPLLCGGKDEHDNGNGSLMRILPVAFVCDAKNSSYKERYELTRDVSSLTHAHPISVLGCHIYINFICHLLAGDNIADAYAKTQLDDYSMYDQKTQDAYARILNDGIGHFGKDDISSSGFVVHTLEAALWCLLNTGSYEEAVLEAVNLGEDTDTVAAVTGSMAGIAYGFDAIPERWTSVLQRFDYLLNLCDNFTETITSN